MVGELTVGKPKYAANEPRLRELIAEAQSLRERLNELLVNHISGSLPDIIAKETGYRQQIK